MALRVKVDLNVCQGHGECTRIAQDLFKLNDDLVLDWDRDPPDSRSQEVEEAVAMCPSKAISLVPKGEHK